MSELKINQARMINNMVNDFINRAFSDRLGKSWYSDATGVAKRNIYEALGYIKIPTFNDYLSRYKRGDISKRIVSAPVSASWRLHPAVKEIQDGTDRTEFDQAWLDLVKQRKVYHYLSRADRISGIGRYGVVYLGYNDGLPPDLPVENTDNLLYMMPYMEHNAQIQTWETDKGSERYGMPLMYQVTLQGFSNQSSQTLPVHYSRILHLAENTDENDTYGTPRLEPILNRLQDLELVAGGSGEMFWRGALPGFNFKIEPDANIDTMNTNDLKDQIELYVHGLQRHLRTQGMDVQSLSPQVASPADHVDTQLKLISATTGIPKRILEGSERGELSSTQDETSWLSLMDERRTQYIEPMILRPFIDQMIMYGVLPEPAKGYAIVWPSLFSPNEKDRAIVAKDKTQALANYANSMGASQILPPEIFLRDFLEYNDDQIAEITAQLMGVIEDDLIDE